MHSGFFSIWLTNFLLHHKSQIDAVDVWVFPSNSWLAHFRWKILCIYEIISDLNYLTRFIPWPSKSIANTRSKQRPGEREREWYVGKTIENGRLNRVIMRKIIMRAIALNLLNKHTWAYACISIVQAFTMSCFFPSTAIDWLCNFCSCGQTRFRSFTFLLNWDGSYKFR